MWIRWLGAVILVVGVTGCGEQGDPQSAAAVGGGAVPSETAAARPSESKAPASPQDSSAAVKQPRTQRFGLVIHGGAGTINPADLTAEQEAEYRAALRGALAAGYAVLDGGGSSVDAVLAAITLMEDSPLFNAGKGAVFTHEGRNEMDASLMDGKTREAGAVAGVRTVKNPILAARAVMESSPHVMLAGRGAEEFCKERGIELVDPAYFRSEERWKQLEKVRASERMELDHGSDEADDKFGTVGAVAVDKNGHIAAGTSTGGMTNKRWGRVGDSPVIGAGTFADDRSCAVSATGHGEFFIREAAAHSVCARVEYGGQTLDEAAHAVVFDRLDSIGGKGGVISLDAKGDMTMPFNTAGMYRGFRFSDGEENVLIWKPADAREQAAHE